MSKRKPKDLFSAPPKKKPKRGSGAGLSNKNHSSLDDFEISNDHGHDNNQQNAVTTHSAASNEPIVLNVGGYRFETSLMTLTSIKDCVFSKMFNGNFSTKPNNKNEYFIDRDGEYFKYILNFMRTNTLILPNEDTFLINCLYQEAVYYQIGSLIKVLDEKRGITPNISGTKYKILNQSVLKKLSSLFHVKNCNFNLLLRMKHHTDSAFFRSEISAKCNEVYPILFLAKLSNDIVGIYCNKPNVKWVNEGIYHALGYSTDSRNRKEEDDYHEKQIWSFNLEPEPVKYQFVQFSSSFHDTIDIFTTKPLYSQFKIGAGSICWQNNMDSSQLQYRLKVKKSIQKNWSCLEVYHCKNLKH